MDRNRPVAGFRTTLGGSLSARRAWIEMIDYVIDYVNDAMSLSARRAWIEIGSADYVEYNYNVALRKESVDRNECFEWIKAQHPGSLSARRAWIEIMYVTRLPRAQVSLSARRAWIEIGVDFAEDWLDASLSARRAWIEILISTRQVCFVCVALRKESVDRNSLGAKADSVTKCRSPQGERG